MNAKKLKLTGGVISAYMLLMVFVSCVNDPEINPFGECGGPRKANATDLTLYYEPSQNSASATESDTVNFKDFNIYLRINWELVSEASTGSSFPGMAFALSCAPNLNFQNITGLRIELLAPYGGQEAGTDISNLVSTHDDIKLSELKDFNGSMGQYRLTVDLEPSNQSQLKTRTVLTLKNGSEKILESTSPVLLTN
ncbi:hypothetical protein ACPUEN_05730 [Algoriphagus yeomjeoni]|uniref:hypothetical protein n=1 Tax=Algoriphagus yeomjeoni TaxID=291403 RepID=UPI003CE5448B